MASRIGDVEVRLLTHATFCPRCENLTDAGGGVSTCERCPAETYQPSDVNRDGFVSCKIPKCWEAVERTWLERGPFNELPDMSLAARRLPCEGYTTSGAVIDVINTQGTYSVKVVSGGEGESGYASGDTIRIKGTSLRGVSPANDLVLTVTHGRDGASGQLDQSELAITSNASIGAVFQYSVMHRITRAVEVPDFEDKATAAKSLLVEFVQWLIESLSERLKFVLDIGGSGKYRFELWGSYS